MGHHSGRGTAAAAMVHSVLADDDSYGVFGMSKHTDSYIRNNNRRAKIELQIHICSTCGCSKSSYVERSNHGLIVASGSLIIPAISGHHVDCTVFKFSSKLT